MKFAFIFPAKVIFAERNITGRPVTIAGRALIAFDELNVYYSTKQNRIVTEAKEGLTAYFAELSGHYLQIFSRSRLSMDSETNDERAEKSLSGYDQESLNSQLANWADSILNPDKYETAQAIRRETIARERAERDAIQAETSARRAETAAASHKAFMEKAYADFMAGEMISWDHFEELCKDHGVTLPINAIGAGRKHISGIGQMTVRISKKCKMQWYVYSKQLTAVLSGGVA